MPENSASEKKKVSLQELMKQKLENKKNQNASENGKANGSLSTQKMRSQQTKKPSNTRRKMGS
jgi:hypothetical protein